MPKLRAGRRRCPSSTISRVAIRWLRASADPPDPAAVRPEKHPRQLCVCVPGATGSDRWARVPRPESGSQGKPSDAGAEAVESWS